MCMCTWATTIPFICHLEDHSVMINSWVIVNYCAIWTAHTCCAHTGAKMCTYSTAIPFICHLGDCSVIRNRWVIVNYCFNFCMCTCLVIMCTGAKSPHMCMCATAIPFIFHLGDHSVLENSWVINVWSRCKKRDSRQTVDNEELFKLDIYVGACVVCFTCIFPTTACHCPSIPLLPVIRWWWMVIKVAKERNIRWLTFFFNVPQVYILV